jgi:hypothetical protein
VTVADRLQRQQLDGALAHDDRLVGLDDRAERMHEQLVCALRQCVERTVLVRDRRSALHCLAEGVDRRLRVAIGQGRRRLLRGRCVRGACRGLMRLGLRFLERQHRSEQDGEHAARS